MSLTLTLTDPAQHSAAELRAVAHFLQVLAANREAAVTIPAQPRELIAALGEQLLHVPTGEIPAAPLAPSGTAAPGASAGDSAPTDQAADAEGEPNTGEIDSQGVKWDARIHSETRSTNKDGSWRQKRGVDKALVEQVLAEQAQGDNDAAASAFTPPPSPEVPAAPVAPAAPATPPPAPDVPAAPVTPPPAPAAVTPADVVRFVTFNKIPPEQAMPVYQSFGLANAAGLFQQPDIAPAVLDALKALVG